MYFSIKPSTCLWINAGKSELCLVCVLHQQHRHSLEQRLSLCDQKYICPVTYSEAGAKQPQLAVKQLSIFLSIRLMKVVKWPINIRVMAVFLVQTDTHYKDSIQGQQGSLSANGEVQRDLCI